jgi:EmrB/QacA subfamily drug resistance transporter
LGLIGFAISSVGCALAPNVALLVAARIVQGMAGALVVPNSLAILETAFHGEARGVAIGRWAAWSGVTSALGPLVGGFISDVASWRFIFVSVVPFALAAAWIAFRHPVTISRKKHDPTPLDYRGALLVTLGLAGIIAGLIAGPESGFTSLSVIAGLVVGTLLLAAFVFQESRAQTPLLPLDVFQSREFVGANLVTLLVYAAINGGFFLLMLQLQNGLRYSALVAGSSLLPLNALILVLSPRAGNVAEKIGARLPMAVGSLIAGFGMLLFMRVKPGAHYMTSVLPAVLVFGIGLGIFVAPLTATALRSLGEKRAGIASGVNNAVARLAGLLATAAIPAASGLGGVHDIRGPVLSAAFTRACVICAVLCGLGAIASAVMIRGKEPSS